MNPFFSVIIPTYNQYNFLIKAIESVQKQTFEDYEIIVVDNNSIDGTEDFIKKQKNIIYKKIQNNGIIAKSRNFGIKLAKGKWISFLDSDDIWFKNKLEKTFDEIKKNNFHVICNDEWIDNSSDDLKRKLWSYGPYEKNFYKKLILYGNRNSTSATSVKRSFLIKNNIKFNERFDFVTCEDFEFFLQIAFNRGIFHYINVPLGVHLFHKKSESSDYSRSFKAQEKVLQYHVYHIQNFSKKDELWNKINKLNKIKSLLFSYKKKNKLSRLLIIIYLMLNIPLTSCFFFIFLIKKLIRQNKLTRKKKFYT